MILFQRFSYGPLAWALSFLTGSELWAPILKVVQNAAIISLKKGSEVGPISEDHEICFRIMVWGV